MFKRQSSNQKGFTLLEVMVTVVVVAALAAGAMQAVNHGIKSSQGRASSQQLAEIESAKMSWLADNPQRADWWDFTANEGQRRVELAPYFRAGFPVSANANVDYIVNRMGVSPQAVVRGASHQYDAVSQAVTGSSLVDQNNAFDVSVGGGSMANNQVYDISQLRTLTYSDPVPTGNGTTPVSEPPVNPPVPWYSVNWNASYDNPYGAGRATFSPTSGSWFVQGSNVPWTLTFDNNIWQFTGWSGSLTGTTTTGTFSAIGETKTSTASFLYRPLLSATEVWVPSSAAGRPNPALTGSTAGSRFNQSATISLAAQANADWNFDGFSGATSGLTVGGGGSSVSGTMGTVDRSITATWTRLWDLNLSASLDPPAPASNTLPATSLTPGASSTHRHNTNVGIGASGPSSSIWEFRGWYEGSTQLSSLLTPTITMDRDITASAIFRYRPRLIWNEPTTTSLTGPGGSPIYVDSGIFGSQLPFSGTRYNRGQSFNWNLRTSNPDWRLLSVSHSDGTPDTAATDNRATGGNNEVPTTSRSMPSDDLYLTPRVVRLYDVIVDHNIASNTGVWPPAARGTATASPNLVVAGSTTTLTTSSVDANKWSWLGWQTAGTPATTGSSLTGVTPHSAVPSWWLQNTGPFQVWSDLYATAVYSYRPTLTLGFNPAVGGTAEHSVGGGPYTTSTSARTNIVTSAGSGSGLRIDTTTFAYRLTAPAGYLINPLSPGTITPAPGGGLPGVSGQSLSSDYRTLTGSLTMGFYNSATPANNDRTLTANLIQSGQISLTKAVVGTPPAGESYSFNVSGPTTGVYSAYSRNMTLSITGAGSQTLSNLFPGNYTVTENLTGPQQAYFESPTGSGVSINVGGGSTASHTVTNRYVPLLTLNTVTNGAMPSGFIPINSILPASGYNGTSWSSTTLYPRSLRILQSSQFSMTANSASNVAFDGWSGGFTGAAAAIPPTAMGGSDRSITGTWTRLWSTTASVWPPQAGTSGGRTISLSPNPARHAANITLSTNGNSGTDLWNFLGWYDSTPTGITSGSSLTGASLYNLSPISSSRHLPALPSFPAIQDRTLVAVYGYRPSLTMQTTYADQATFRSSIGGTWLSGATRANIPTAAPGSGSDLRLDTSTVTMEATATPGHRFTGGVSVTPSGGTLPSVFNTTLSADRRTATGMLTMGFYDWATPSNNDRTVTFDVIQVPTISLLVGNGSTSGTSGTFDVYTDNITLTTNLNAPGSGNVTFTANPAVSHTGLPVAMGNMLAGNSASGEYGMPPFITFSGPLERDTTLSGWRLNTTPWRINLPTPPPLVGPLPPNYSPPIRTVLLAETSHWPSFNTSGITPSSRSFQVRASNPEFGESNPVTITYTDIPIAVAGATGMPVPFTPPTSVSSLPSTATVPQYSDVLMAFGVNKIPDLSLNPAASGSASYQVSGVLPAVLTSNGTTTGRFLLLSPELRTQGTVASQTWNATTRVWSATITNTAVKSSGQQSFGYVYFVGEANEVGTFSGNVTAISPLTGETSTNTTTVTVTPWVEPGFTKTARVNGSNMASGAILPAGTEVTYSLQIHERSGINAFRDIEVVDFLHPALEYVSGSVSYANFRNNGSLIAGDIRNDANELVGRGLRFTGLEVGAGSTATITFRARVLAQYPAGSLLPPGAKLMPGSVLPAGSLVIQGTRLPNGTLVTSDTITGSPITIPAGEPYRVSGQTGALTAASPIVDGTKVPNKATLIFRGNSVDSNEVEFETGSVEITLGVVKSNWNASYVNSATGTNALWSSSDTGNNRRGVMILQVRNVTSVPISRLSAYVPTPLVTSNPSQFFALQGTDNGGVPGLSGEIRGYVDTTLRINSSTTPPEARTYSHPSGYQFGFVGGDNRLDPNRNFALPYTRSTAMDVTNMPPGTNFTLQVPITVPLPATTVRSLTKAAYSVNNGPVFTTNNIELAALAPLNPPPPVVVYWNKRVSTAPSAYTIRTSGGEYEPPTRDTNLGNFSSNASLAAILRANTDANNLPAGAFPSDSARITPRTVTGNSTVTTSGQNIVHRTWTAWDGTKMHTFTEMRTRWTTTTREFFSEDANVALAYRYDVSLGRLVYIGTVQTNGLETVLRLPPNEIRGVVINRGTGVPDSIFEQIGNVVSYRIIEEDRVTSNVTSLGQIWASVTPVIISMDGKDEPDLLAGKEWRIAQGREPVAEAMRPVDLDGGGIRHWEWVGPQAGILVWNPEGRETLKVEAWRLFGQTTWNEQWTHGFEPLQRLDANNDGDLADEELAPLSVWRDLNGDATIQTGELEAAQSVLDTIRVEPTGDGTNFESHATLKGGRRVKAWDWWSNAGLPSTAASSPESKKLEGTQNWVFCDVSDPDNPQRQPVFIEGRENLLYMADTLRQWAAGYPAIGKKIALIARNLEDAQAMRDRLRAKLGSGVDIRVLEADLDQLIAEGSAYELTHRRTLEIAAQSMADNQAAGFPITSAPYDPEAIKKVPVRPPPLAAEKND